MDIANQAEVHVRTDESIKTVEQLAWVKVARQELTDQCAMCQMCAKGGYTLNVWFKQFALFSLMRWPV